MRDGADRCVLLEMQAILRGLRGRTDTRIGAISRRVFSSLFAVPEIPISGQSGHSIKEKQKTWVFGEQRPSGIVAGCRGLEIGERRMKDMPNQLTGDVLHCKS